ncbi:MAG: hypothetical protein IPK74_28970 [Deltaproteobacteria bacterium]|nr:hypothetical protein [Deltaproteobacteria bacterium]
MKRWLADRRPQLPAQAAHCATEAYASTTSALRRAEDDGRAWWRELARRSGGSVAASG